MIRCHEIDEDGGRIRSYSCEDVCKDPDVGEYLAHWMAERAAEEFDREDESARIIEVEGACGQPVRYRVRRRIVCRYSAEQIEESPRTGGASSTSG